MSLWPSWLTELSTWQFFFFLQTLSFKTSRKKKREFFSSGRLKAVQIFFLVHISLVARSERQRCEKMSFIRRKTREFWPGGNWEREKTNRRLPAKLGAMASKVKIVDWRYYSRISERYLCWSALEHEHYKGKEKPSISPTGGNRLSHYYWDNSRVEGVIVFPILVFPAARRLLG